MEIDTQEAVAAKPVHVQRVRISQVLGTERLLFEPGKVTVISGHNEAGKTSILEAVRSVFQGGHDATLLRRGATEGEVVLELDDGTTIRKRVGPESSQTTVKHPELGRLAKPAEFLKSLLGDGCLNPVEFLEASAKEQVKHLLRALRPTVDAVDLVAATGGLTVKGLDTSGNAIEIIARERKRLYDERTGVNRMAEEKRIMAEGLSASLPAKEVLELDAETAQKRLNDQEVEIRRQADAQVEALRQKAKDEIEAKKQAVEAAEKLWVASSMADHQAINDRIAALESQLATERAALKQLDGAIDSGVESYRSELATYSASRIATFNAEAASIRSAQAPVLTQIKADWERVNEQAKAQASAKKTVEIVGQLQDAAGQAEQRSQALTKAIQGLDALAEKQLSAIPIPGLTVTEDGLLLNGVPLERCSQAQQVELALAVARLGAGRLKLMVVDGLERLDAERFAAFREVAEQGDYQLIVTRVSDGNLALNGARELVYPQNGKGGARGD